VGDSPVFTPPPIRSFRLANGVPVLFLEQHSPGFVRVNVLLRTQPAPFGANAMAARNLWLGTKTMSQQQLQTANDGDLAGMTSSYAWGWLRIAMTAPSERTASVVARLSDLVLSAMFPVSAVIRVTRDVAHESESADDAPRSIASRVVPMALYGSPPLDEETKDLRSTDIGALRRDEIADAYAAALDPSSAVLVVIGDATEATVKPLLEKSFGQWHGHGKPASRKVTHLPVATSAPRLVVVDHPGAQSLVTFGGEGPAYTSPDWAPSVALRMIVNGSKGRAASALHDVGAHGSAFTLVANPAAPRVAFTTEVATGRTAEALADIDHLMRAMKGGQISDGEVDDGRRPILLDEAAWTWTLAGETDTMEGLVVQGLPPEDVARRTARFLAIKADDVRRVAARYLDPDRMKIVVVGDWSKLREPLTGLGWGPIELRNTAGAVMNTEPGRP
jgi:zinc protease